MWRTKTRRPSTSKVLTKQLKNDGQLVQELIVAEKLGYCLAELREKMTVEELYLWAAFYQLRADEEQKQIDKAKRGRR